MSNQLICLEPHSLYITTQPLVNGRFHWTLVLTDGQCNASQHYWHDSAKGSNIDKYSSRIIGRVSARTSKDILAYYKITGYTPSIGEVATFIEVCRSVYTNSTRSHKGARDREYTCRTWVLGVLGELEARGIIRRSEPVEGVENTVVRRSQELETIYLEMFLQQKLYVAQVHIA